MTGLLSSDTDHSAYLDLSSTILSKTMHQTVDVGLYTDPEHPAQEDCIANHDFLFVCLSHPGCRHGLDVMAVVVKTTSPIKPHNHYQPTN